MNDLTIILRECGERTADAAYSLLNSPELGGNVERVSEVPFSACLRRSLEVGLSSGRKWTLCIDADVLVDAKAIQQLIHYAEQTPSHVFEVQGFVFDKFFGVERPAGNHLYRTELLEKSLPLIPEEGTTLRPENTLLNNMTAEGHPCVQSPIVVGLHDFEQWEHNVFTKAFLQAHKHDWLADYLKTVWSGFPADSDYRIAEMGLNAGLEYDETVYVDNTFLGSVADLSQIDATKKKYQLPPDFCAASTIFEQKKRMSPAQLQFDAELKFRLIAPQIPPAMKASAPPLPSSVEPRHEESLGSIRTTTNELLRILKLRLAGKR